MENNKFSKTLYNTPTWLVLSHILQHPDKPVRGSKLTKALPRISKSAIYNAIQQLEKIDVLTREKEDEAYTFNRSHAWLRSMMVTQNLTTLQPLIEKLKTLSLKIILFGSRSTSDYHSGSDYDLLVVTSQATTVRQFIKKTHLAEQIQLIVKTSEEWIDLHMQNPELYQSLQQGIVLWEQK